MAHLLIAAAHKSSGKTTVTLGLCAALRQRGLAVQPFKKGPDYIDPMWLALAAGHPCHNLDFYTQSHEEILASFARRARDADLAIVEANKGLYDGLDLDGSNSNAALAKLLGAPVVLVIDTQGMTRGVAPLLLGYQAFDPDVQIAGVILNKVGGARHEGKLRAVIERYTDLPVLGAVYRNAALEITERHLGLIPSNETGAARAQVERIAAIVGAQVDLDRLLQLAAVPAPVARLARVPVAEGLARRVRIGIARDAAFGFYYPGDLEALGTAGAELVPFDCLHDQRLPAVDGLFIGGGFPETQMEQLEANAALRGEIRAAIEAGLPTYAECGGLMYLARSLRWRERACAMVGVIPADVLMHDKPIGRGYIHLRETGNGPWPLRDGAGQPADFHAHEFHYSALENLAPDVRFAFDVLRGTGIDGHHDGIVYRNTLACFAHQRDVAANHWAARFVDFVGRCTLAHTGPDAEPGSVPSQGLISQSR